MVETAEYAKEYSGYLPKGKELFPFSAAFHKLTPPSRHELSAYQILSSISANWSRDPYFPFTVRARRET